MEEASEPFRKSEEPHAVLLDVGHGNAAIFIDGDVAIVVDAGSGDLVTDTLERLGVREIAALVISHRHHDHTSELPALLSNRELQIRRLFVNADPSRDPSSRFETLLRGAINDSWKRNRTELDQANVTLSEQMNTQHLEVEVLWPGVEIAMTGVGAATTTDGTVHPHAMAVVLRVARREGRSVLLGADLDYAGFRQLIDDPDTDLSADVLVYPHHGGLAGAGSAAGEQQFATDLAQAVTPELVVFSNGRGRHDNPRPEVVRGIRQARDSPKIRLVCTQLSRQCSPDAFADDGRLDTTLGSAGGVKGLSCSGSIRVALAGPGPLLPFGHRHIDFVVNKVGESALCIGHH